MKTTKLILTMLAILSTAAAWAQNPKREFRGAWLHTVYQAQYHNQTTQQNKQYIISQLDSLKQLGINAVIFQVRPQADAFYQSNLEPWSRYLTDNGNPPQPYWDPLQFIIEEAHSRGLELHAWLNPYRVTSSAKQKLPQSHIYHKHPERFVKYDGKLYFDPALPQNREFIGQVIDDIISRYDIDGIHFDDYFYPYPVEGKEFPDNDSYQKYGNGIDRGDWRRKNVDLLIHDIHKRISTKKPWVRFGISPFGIYRNKSTDPNGSETNGLQNYDALYADVLLWERNGWIDYLLPQLYWELEHKAASYIALVNWWNKNAGQNRHLYIGQDVSRTMTKQDLPPSTQKTQLNHKIKLARQSQNIQGNCWWPGYALTRNTGGIADSLTQNIQNTIALVPAYPWISDSKPQPVQNITVTGNQIAWTAPQQKNKTTDIIKYVIYKIKDPNNIDITDPQTIIDITPRNSYTITNPGHYIITALDRVNNESDPSQPITIR